MAFSLLAGSTMSVSAAEYEVGQDGQNADVQVEYDNPSTFCVNIPESINLNTSNGYKIYGERDEPYRIRKGMYLCAGRIDTNVQ